MASKSKTSKQNTTTNASLSSPATLTGAVHYSLKKISPRKTDNKSIHEWLESMKESSPPRSRRCLRSDTSATLEPETPDTQYKAWKARHPSALDNFDRIFEVADAKQIFVFLDYDGTLSPIVEDPERAFMSDEMRNVVKEVATFFVTAIITGRRREKVYEFVQLPELYYAGSHGMDIMGPLPQTSNGVKTYGTKTLDGTGNEVVLFQPANDITCIMDEVYRLLEEKARKISGARIEHNKFCVSVHFRCVKEENWLHLAEEVNSVIKSYPNLYATQGRKVLEIRPSILWNKGRALEFLIRTLGFANRNGVFPIYIGDDQTDEDAFKVVARRRHGLSILVSDSVKETHASHSLQDPNEVLKFLQHLVKWRKMSVRS
ncbi:hypothetical protein KP509_06G065500 [Ceratopteris richardii]|nr:hypothetical protein KP509_06G065500 [Ceratopteris richardii]KAH7435447.1 hypothetical protein KP509_06G065500 [Ceratopteris richardii]